jgi:hypothetical protein
VIWASCEFDGTDLNFLPVLNPGACRGKTWLIEFIGPVPIWVVVEAESVTSAIEVLNSDPAWGDFHYVQDDHSDDSNTQPVRVHGQARCEVPFPVRYHDGGYPTQGLDPRRYAAARFN